MTSSYSLIVYFIYPCHFFLLTTSYASHFSFLVCVLYYAIFFVFLGPTFLYIHPFMIHIFFTYPFFCALMTHLFFYLCLLFSVFLCPTFFIYTSFYDTHLFSTYAFYFSPSYAQSFFIYTSSYVIRLLFFTYAFYFLSAYARSFFIYTSSYVIHPFFLLILFTFRPFMPTFYIINLMLSVFFFYYMHSFI